MRFFAAVAAFATVVTAERITVLVGDNNGLTYSPESVVAKEGDVLAFQFRSKNHTLTQSTFVTPCVPLAGGTESGYLAVAAGATEFPEWSITLNNVTAPMWFYCAQGRHCQSGMVFAINPTPERTFEAFKANAQGVPSAGIPGPTTGAPTTSAPAANGTNAPTDTSDNVPSTNSASSVVSKNSAALLAVVGLAAGLML